MAVEYSVAVECSVAIPYSVAVEYSGCKVECSSIAESVGSVQW